MKTQKFRRSRTFVCDSEICCLTATASNAAIPDLAAKQITKNGKAPEFNIFLRAKDPAKIAKWQKEMLNRLFEKVEVTRAIEDGMSDYDKDFDHSRRADHEKKAWEDIKQNGALPHVALHDVIIDDIKREVILVLGTEADGHLAEHGIVIYLKNGVWKFDSDRLSDYLNEVEEEESEREHPHFEEEEKPAKPAGTNDFNEVTFMVGTWVFDGETSREQRRKEGESEKEIESLIRGWDIERRQIELSEKLLLYWQKYSPWLKPSKKVIMRYEKNKSFINVEYQDEGEGEVKTWGFTYENDRLKDMDGWIYKRKTDPQPAQSTSLPNSH